MSFLPENRPLLVGERQHHAREGDPVRDAVVQPSDERAAPLVIRHEVELPEGPPGIERLAPSDRELPRFDLRQVRLGRAGVPPPRAVPVRMGAGAESEAGVSSQGKRTSCSASRKLRTASYECADYGRVRRA